MVYLNPYVSAITATTMGPIQLDPLSVISINHNTTQNKTKQNKYILFLKKHT